MPLNGHKWNPSITVGTSRFTFLWIPQTEMKTMTVHLQPTISLSFFLKKKCFLVCSWKVQKILIITIGTKEGGKAFWVSSWIRCFSRLFFNSKKVTLNSHITKVIIIAFITKSYALVFPLGITMYSCTFNQQTAHTAVSEILPTYWWCC